MVSIMDVACLLGFTRLSFVHNVIQFISRPFQNYLLLEDLEEFEGREVARIAPPEWKILAITVASIFQVAIYIASFFFQLTAARGPIHVWATGAVGVAWVRLHAPSSLTAP
jgi:hypothetical protein